MSSGAGRTVAVIGASPKKDRYSNLAVNRLVEKGYRVLPVNPAYRDIEGLAAVESVTDAARTAGEGGLDTISLYVGPAHLSPLIPDLVAARPRRVIFNPGTESPEAMRALDDAGIPWLKACTLVLLSTGQF